MDKTPTRKILFAAGRLAGGGAERQLVQLASALCALGSDVTVTTLVDRIEGLPFRQVVLWNGKRDSPLGTAWHLLHAGIRLRSAVRTHRPDVVISWLAIPTMLSGLMAANMGVPLIVALRNSTPERASSLPRVVQYALLRSAISRCGLVVANSTSGIDGYKQARLLGDRPYRIIPNSIDHSRFHPPTATQRAEARATLGLRPDGPIVAYVGRAAPVKQIPLLAATIERLTSTMPYVEFLVVGMARDALCAAAHDAGVALPVDRVVAPGRLQRIEHAYWACDALVLTSQREGSPNSVHEARACGVPIVSTDVGDVRATASSADRIVHADARALSAALIDVLRLGTTPAQMVHYLDPTECAREWLACIEELLS